MACFVFVVRIDAIFLLCKCIEVGIVWHVSITMAIVSEMANPHKRVVSHGMRRDNVKWGYADAFRAGKRAFRPDLR